MKKYILLGGLLLLSLSACGTERPAERRKGGADWCRELRQSGNGGENDCLSVLYESGIG